MTGADVKLYTLPEAKLAINAETCERQGHDYQIVVAASNSPERIICQRCGLNWKVTPSSDEHLMEMDC